MSETISYMLKSASSQMTGSMAGILAKAKAYAGTLGVEESVLLNSRLYPDMLPLVRQVQIASDTLARGAARLGGLEMPSFPDTETSFDALIARLKTADAYVQKVGDAALNASENKVLEVPLGPVTMNWEGRQYLSTFVLPNLHFHASILYALLRAQGVKIGKRDFLTGG